MSGNAESEKSGKIEIAPEQCIYAAMLHYSTWAGIVLLVILFFLYVTGYVDSYVRPSEMPQYWGLGVSEYHLATGIPQGLGWLRYTRYADFACVLGAAFLACLTAAGYLAILLPAYIRNRDKFYIFIAAAEILVLVLAASGLLAV